MRSLINKLFGNWDPLDCELVKLMANMPSDVDCCANCHKGGKNAHVTVVTLHLKEPVRVRVCCVVAGYFDAKPLLN